MERSRQTSSSACASSGSGRQRCVWHAHCSLSGGPTGDVATRPWRRDNRMRLFVTRRSLAKQIQGGLAEDGIPVLAVGIAEQPRLGERTSAHDAVLLDGSLCESLNYAALLRWWRTRLNAYLLALLP